MTDARCIPETMFSSFPLILGLLGIFGLVLRDRAQRLRLAEAMASVFPSQVGDLLGFIEETHELSGRLGVISLVGLIWSGYWLFQTMELVFNHFYGGPDRTFREQVVMAVLMMGLYAALFTLSVLASFAANFLVAVSDRAVPLDLAGFDPLLGWLLALGSAVAMFLAIYWVTANAPLALAEAWSGALLAGFLFVLLNQAFPVYFSILGGSYAAYDTLGLFLMLMTWFYCLAVILVLGIELNAFLGGHGGAVQKDVAAMQALMAVPIVPGRLHGDGAATGRRRAVGGGDGARSVAGDRGGGHLPPLGDALHPSCPPSMSGWRPAAP